MANYYASCRTNYFKVEDVDKFLTDMEGIPDIEIHVSERGICILGNNPDGGGWPCFVYDEEAEDDIEFDIYQKVAEYLADDEVAIFMEVGAEKLRYLVGFAVAINNQGEHYSVSLNNIYELAEELTNRPENITTVEY